MRVALDAILTAVIHFHFLVSTNFKTTISPAAIIEPPNPPNSNVAGFNITPIREAKKKDQMRKTKPTKIKVALDAILLR